MRLEHIEYMIEVAKYGSINAAAEKLHLNQQNLNKMMKGLENELGYPLLNRTKKGVTLTSAGEVALGTFQDIIQKLQHLHVQLEAMDEQVSTVSGTIRVGVSPVISLSVLPFVFKEFLRQYPNIHLYVNDKYRDEIMNKVSNNEMDLGIMSISTLIPGALENVPENIEVVPIKQYPTYIVMSPDHPLANHSRLSLNTIQPYPLIVYEAGGAQGVNAFENKVALSTDNYRLCEECLQSQDAIMYSYPLFIKRNLFSKFVHIPLSDRNALTTIYMAMNKDCGSSKRHLIQLFLNRVSEYL